MPPLRDAIRYPAKRVLLQRTRLAYVHLRNLLTDAKRDRTARVSGYVAVWMPEELLVLFLEEGEVVNATSSADGVVFHPIAISEAIGRVPTAAEYGSICFHEASNEQLDLMFASQTGTAMVFPRELNAHAPAALLAYLDGLMIDGALEIIADGSVNYASLAEGRPTSGCFVDPRAGDVTAHIRLLLEGKSLAAPPIVRLWPVPDALPTQASPALIQSYRELMPSLALRLMTSGKSGAAEIVEGARRSLVARHPMLERFSPALEKPKDPVTDSASLTKAIAAWITDVLWAAGIEDATPEELLKELTSARRHVFQAAGLFESLPWKVKW
jgi:hypothetical protein